MRKWLTLFLALALAAGLASVGMAAQPVAVTKQGTLPAVISPPTTAPEPDGVLRAGVIHPHPGIALGGTATLLLSGKLTQTTVAGASHFTLSGQYVQSTSIDLTSYLEAEVTALVTPSRRAAGEQGPATMDIVQIWRLQGARSDLILLTPVRPIRIMVRGQAVHTDVPPLLMQGRTLVPVRAIAEALGATVSWDAEHHMVTVARGGKTVYVTIGDNHIIVVEPGYPARTMIGDAPPLIAEGRTLMPVRLLSEALGFQVDWEAAASVVIVR